MRRARRVDGVTAARTAAGLLAAAGAALLWWRPAAGIVLLVTAAALLLVARRDVAAVEEPPLARLVSELGLKGPGHHVPADRGVRLFIPADAKGPYLVPELGPHAIHRDPPASIGLALDPPGAPLLASWAAIDGLPRGHGAEEAFAHLRRAVPRLGLGTRLRVGQQGDTIVVRCRLHRPEAAWAAQQAGWHMQGGSAVQSFMCGVVALALGRPVRVQESRTEPDGSFFLEVVAGSSA